MHMGNDSVHFDVYRYSSFFLPALHSLQANSDTLIGSEGEHNQLF